MMTPSKNKHTRSVRFFMLACTTVVFAGLLLVPSSASAEERKFVVMLAYSPKSFIVNGQPGLPPGGLFDLESIRKDYFDRIDPNIDSFVEYWNEISYGAVFVSGDVFGWVTLPWPFDTNPPNAPARPSPANFIDLRIGDLPSEGLRALPGTYTYGAGEDFCDGAGSGGADTTISSDKCGALIIIDHVGAANVSPPERGAGLNDHDAVGINVWTPGERFVDVDGDLRWDGLDEKNDRMCHGEDGCRNACNRFRCGGNGVDCSSHSECPAGTPCIPSTISGEGSDLPCTTDCPAGTGEQCGDPTGLGPRGCKARGCGDLPMPFIDWDSSDDASNDANCLIVSGADLIPCDSPSECDNIDDTDLGAAACIDGFCKPSVCALPVGGGTPTLPECCDQDDPEERANCLDGGGVEGGTENVTCGTPIVCCEFFDADQDNNLDVTEPFEDFIVRWEPKGATRGSVWVAVDEDYIQNNYPGDVKALVRRTGNGYYDSPDLFIDRGNTKMMQDAGRNRFAWRTPKPGTRYSSGPPNFEQPWFDSFWQTRYGSQLPPWPCGADPGPCDSNGNIGRNSPIMRPFNPTSPTPPVVAGPSGGRRWFKANAGGWNGNGRGNADNPDLRYDLGSDTLAESVLPEEQFGYYDGWVEHDDLASSIYHRAGDKRLGEIIAPSKDRVFVPGTDDGAGGEGQFTAIFGVDLGKNDPLGGADNATPDNFCVAAGPGAVNIHGEKGFDAGDVCIVEWLTWRTDGTSRTVGTAWETENGPYHPFAGPSSPRASGAFGFRDYNLDGMIDQGEVRPELSENYSVDSNPETNPNDGFDTDYPFNRRRIVEDVVEALDPTVDWDRYIHDVRSPEVHEDDVVSGIVIVPSGSYADPGLFPFSPGFYPIQTLDAAGVRFHDLVVCRDCQDPPSAVNYSAHEYLHTWENYPDLYDYEILETPVTGQINCPIGDWDIMAGSGEAAGEETVGGGLVHPNPALKERSGWVTPANLENLVTPGVTTTLTLPPAELDRDESYLFLSNPEGRQERYYFWSAGSGFDERMPGAGLLVLYTQDYEANPEALALQQRTPPFNFRIVQADGRGDLEACSAGGNTGDEGDVWPGAVGATEFNFNTNPKAVWESGRWTGLNISEIEPDGAGSVRLTLSWVPTDIPTLRFINPPGGATQGSVYTAKFDVSDLHGGTKIRLFYTRDPRDLNMGTNLIGSRSKSTDEPVRLSLPWDISGLADGRYFLFAKLNPGVGPDGERERTHTDVSTGRNNVGNGTLTVDLVSIDDDTQDTDDKARLETWSAVCIDNGQKWRVNGTITQPILNAENPNSDPWRKADTCCATDPTCSTQSPRACCPRTTPGNCQGLQYESAGGEVKFTIQEGSVRFQQGDAFSFTTTGITAVSRAVTIAAGKITEDPVAIIRATPLAGDPPLTVNFDARDSVDPNGEPLDFRWTFGDGSAPATGPQVEHTFQQAGTFTVVLRATNPRNEGFGESAVDIRVTNNSPNAVVDATPTSGQAPLEVQFGADGSSDRETPKNRLIYHWDFGDGGTANNELQPGPLFEGVTHTYRTRQDGTACTRDNPCTFIATLTVIDEGEREDTDTIEILVGNTNPVASVTVDPTQGPAPLVVEFNAIGSSDPDGDDLKVIWDFDDPQATTANPNVRELPPDGTDGTGIVRHTYAQPGTYTPTAQIIDLKADGTAKGGETNWLGTTITVTGNIPPEAAFDLRPATGSVGESITFDASASTDPDSEIASYVWNFGDGSPAGHGQIVQHTYTQARPAGYTVRLTVTDDRGATDSVTRRLVIVAAPINRNPIAHIAAGPGGGAAPFSRTFDGRTSFDPDGDQLAYAWTLVLGGVSLPVTSDGQGNWIVPPDFTNPPGGALYTCSREPGAVTICAAKWGSDLPEFIDSGEEDVTFRASSSSNGATLPLIFRSAGEYDIELSVADGRQGVGQDEVGVRVTEAGVTPPPPPPPPPSDGGGQGNQPPDSANQRPSPLGMCGLGLLPAFFATLLGLTTTRIIRRRRR